MAKTQDSESDDFSDSDYEEVGIVQTGEVIFLYVALLKPMVQVIRTRSICIVVYACSCQCCPLFKKL